MIRRTSGILPSRDCLFSGINIRPYHRLIRTRFYLSAIQNPPNSQTNASRGPGKAWKALNSKWPSLRSLAYCDDSSSLTSASVSELDLSWETGSGTATTCPEPTAETITTPRRRPAEPPSEPKRNRAMLYLEG